MGILSINLDFAGQAGVNPRLGRMVTTDNFATITAVGYLTGAIAEGYTFYPSDFLFINYNGGANNGVFEVKLSGLTPYLSAVLGTSILPVVSGDFANFSGTEGDIADLGYAPSNAAKTTVVMANGAVTSGRIAAYVDTAGTVGDGGVLANRVLTSAITTPDVSIDLVSFDVTVGQAALASGGSVTLYASSGSKQYKVRSLQINSGGTNFSGGGGDRLGQVTDATTVYSVIPAASLQTLANAQWGVTGLPNPGSAAINTSTAAGASLVFKYSGGTTDYSAGSIVVSGILQRIA